MDKLLTLGSSLVSKMAPTGQGLGGLYILDQVNQVPSSDAIAEGSKIVVALVTVVVQILTFLKARKKAA